MFDVVIVGGGPAGSTCSTLLKKYNPGLSVLVLEKAKFPREHIGESQLPTIGPILHEMGVWDKVEAANFPIKVGVSYTWGRSSESWDFDFVPLELFVEEPRPAQYTGQRTQTAFQVERSIYDDILLRHAESMGVEVREETGVANVHVEEAASGKRVVDLELDSGETVTGRYYIDASGSVGLLRRALGVESEAPKQLRNIAVWDYWENAEWAVEIGVGGTRVQVRSLPYGWMWFIPMGPTRTSIGLICPSDYIKQTGAKPADLYLKAAREQPDIAKLTKNATPRGKIESCRDWSHLADQLCGENWFLCGEAAGFADPILAAGMALAHNSAREVAYTVLELERGELEPEWLRTRYDERNRTNIKQHIRFAQYWYAANGHFSDLQENCSAIAQEAGLSLKPQAAWRWLSQGGFATESVEQALFGSFDIAAAKQVIERFGDKTHPEEEEAVGWHVNRYNRFTLYLEGADKRWIGQLRDGKIRRVLSYVRDGNKLPRAGAYLELINLLQKTSDVQTILQVVGRSAAKLPPNRRQLAMTQFFQTLDVMVEQGWVRGSVDPSRPFMRMSTENSRMIRNSHDTQRALAQAGRSDILKSNLDGEKADPPEAATER
ncbi:MAG: NAD(P)/FAD-dependent oxidoreductase [Phycisphaerales bacterium JB063]